MRPSPPSGQPGAPPDAQPTSKEGAPSKVPVQERLKGLIEDYGPVAIGTHVTILALTVAGFAVAISAGWREGTGGDANLFGLIGAAYLASRVTSIPRIFLTLALTPLVARVIGRGPKSRAPDA